MQWIHNEASHCYTNKLPKADIWPPHTLSWYLYHLLPAWGVVWLRGHGSVWITTRSFWTACSPPGFLIHPKSLSMTMHADSTSTVSTVSLAASNTANFWCMDRFHWRGHVGCSSGYCLDVYGDATLRCLNSQVNEQANAGLQRIRGQLAYMTAANFKFHPSLFLSIKNYRIVHFIDISQLSVN